MILAKANLLDPGVATITASSADATYIATNAGRALDRYVPARTTVATDSWWKWDLGSAKALGLLIMTRFNFPSFRIEGNATDSWGSPSYQLVVSAATRNPFNGQYVYAVDLSDASPVAFNFRWLRIFVPAQTPVALDVDGSALSVFSLGSAYGGLKITPPTKWSVDFEHVRLFPEAVVRPRHDGWSKTANMGNTLVRLVRPRTTLFSYGTPFLNDDARSWLLDVDASVRAAGSFALFEDLSNPSMGWIVKMIGGSISETVDAPSVTKFPWELEEVIAS